LLIKDALIQTMREESDKEVQLLHGIIKEKEQKLAEIISSPSYKLQEELLSKEKQLDISRTKSLELEETQKMLDEKYRNANDSIKSIRQETESKQRIICDLTDQLRDAQAASPVRPTKSLNFELEKLREAVQAHQSENRFLSSELTRLEKQMKLLEEAKNETIASVQRNLEEARNEYNSLRGILLTSVSVDDYTHKLEIENLNLKKEYFLSLAVSVKLHRSLVSESSNVDVISLYEQAVSHNVPVRSWPEWLSNNLDASINATPPLLSNSNHHQTTNQ